MTEIGLGIQTDKRMADYQGLATAAEEYGIDVISVYNDIPYGSPIPALLAMAAVTSAIRLGPASMNPATIAPHEIAGHIAALDEASGGRAYLGLVRGSWLNKVGASAPSVLDMTEALEVIRRLLSGDDSGYEGKRFRLAPGIKREYPVVRRAIPVMVGTWGPRLARVAAALADEIKVGGSANPDMVEVMQRHASVPIVLGAVSVVDGDRAVARALARRHVAMYLDVVAELDPTVEPDPQAIAALRSAIAQRDLKRAADSIPDELLDRFAFAGTPDEVADHVATLYEAGAHRVELGTPHGVTPKVGIDLIGRHVVPATRMAFG